MNSWLFFGLLGPILWGTSNVLGGTIRRTYVKNDFALTWFLAVMRLPVAIFLLFIFSINLEFTSSTIGLLFAGILWVIPFIFYYYSLNLEEASRVALLLQFAPIFTLIGSYILLHERLTPIQGIAFIFLFLGGIFAALRRLEGKWHISKVIILIAIACISWAISDVFFRKYYLEIGDFWTSFAWFFLGSSLVAPIIMLIPKYGKNLPSYFKGLSARGYTLLIIDQIVGTSGSLFFAYALTLGKASLTGVLQAIQPLAAFGMALVLPHLIREVEHENTSRSTLMIKGISFVLILAGLVALSV